MSTICIFSHQLSCQQMLLSVQTRDLTFLPDDKYVCSNHMLSITLHPALMNASAGIFKDTLAMPMPISQIIHTNQPTCVTQNWYKWRWTVPHAQQTCKQHSDSYMPLYWPVMTFAFWQCKLGSTELQVTSPIIACQSLKFLVASICDLPDVINC